jgi:hypothetical protein
VPVVPHLEMEGVVELSLVGLGQQGQVSAADREQFQQGRPVGVVSGGGGGGPGVEGCELFGDGAPFTADGDEAALQAGPPAGVEGRVPGGFVGFQLGEEVVLSPVEPVQVGA